MTPCKTQTGKPMEKITIERAGVPNLDFVGEIIGQSGGPNPRIKIYRTEGNLFVAQMDANMTFSKAQQFDKPDGAINWLRALNSTTYEWEVAVEDAAGHDAAFKAIWNIEVK